MRQTVLLDVDGVIANFRKLYVDSCNSANSTSFTVDDTGNDWSFARSMHLTREQQEKTWEKINRKGAAGAMELLPGALNGVRALMEEANVYFVTSPVPSSPTWTYDRNAWLSAKFRINAQDHVIYTAQKRLVRGDFFIDDKPEAVWDWARDNPGSSVGVIWGAPTENIEAEYRVSFTTPGLKERVFQYNSWETLVTAVKASRILR